MILPLHTHLEQSQVRLDPIYPLNRLTVQTTPRQKNCNHQLQTHCTYKKTQKLKPECSIQNIYTTTVNIYKRMWTNQYKRHRLNDITNYKTSVQNNKSPFFLSYLHGVDAIIALLVKHTYMEQHAFHLHFTYVGWTVVR